MLFPEEPATAVLDFRFHGLLAEQHARVWRDVLNRDSWQCHSCHLMMPGWMEIDHLNGDHGNNRPSNLSAICHWCHRIKHPAAWCEDLKIIWWPELDQSQIIRLLWAVAGLEQACEAFRKRFDTTGRPDTPPDRSSVAQSLFATKEELEQTSSALQELKVALSDRRKLAYEMIGTQEIRAFLEVILRHPEHWDNLDTLRWQPIGGCRVFRQTGPEEVTTRVKSALLDNMRKLSGSKLVDRAVARREEISAAWHQLNERRLNKEN